MALDGLAVPVATLFGPDGALDTGRNARFTRDLSDAKVDHVFVLGSLGEFPSITDPERERLVDIVIESATGKTDVWVGCGAPSTKQAVAYAEAAEAAGASAIVAVAPYYLHPTMAAVERYFRALRVVVSGPLLAYNIPSLVGYALPPELVHRLARDGVIQGLKDTAGSLASVEGFLTGAPAEFPILPGDDALAVEAIAKGASGAVMGSANIVPKLGVALVTAARARDAAKSAELQGILTGLLDAMHAGPFPATVKFLAQRLRGADVGYRAPYDALAPEEEAAVLARLAPVEERLRPFLGK